jgi:hypothetical protein
MKATNLLVLLLSSNTSNDFRNFFALAGPTVPFVNYCPWTARHLFQASFSLVLELSKAFRRQTLWTEFSWPISSVAPKLA